MPAFWITMFDQFKESKVAVLILAGVGLVVLWKQKGKKVALAFGIVCGVLGILGLLQAFGLVSGIPILTYGIPAVLSCYFDLFSGFVQAYVGCRGKWNYG